MAKSSLPRRVLRRVAVAAYSQRLRRAAARAHSLGDLVDVASHCRLGPLRIRPMQVREEILDLLTLIRERGPKTLVEIGTARGGTLFLLCRVAAPDATLVTVDLPPGDSKASYPPWKAPLYQSFGAAGQRVHLIRGDSSASETRQEVRQALNQQPIDFLWIDGDHRYEGARRDFEGYAPLVRPGGLIALHDIRPGPPELVGGVPRFWREIKTRYPHREILAPGDYHGFGIGVLVVPGVEGIDGRQGFDSGAPRT